MKQLINSEVREMTDEEVTEYLQMLANTEPPLEDKAEAYDILIGGTS